MNSGASRTASPSCIQQGIAAEAGWIWLLIFCAAVWSQEASAQDVPDAAVQNQWFTGSLEAPSPALSKAGLFVVEPYAIYMSNTGAYNGHGGQYSVPDDVSEVQSVTVLKYGITDRLTIQALPSFDRAWNSQSNFVGAGDLPVELEYRFNDEDNKTGFPSLTVELGMTFPTGDYDRLHTAIDGLGSGAYTAKEGFLLQSLFDTWGNHPMRFRLYGAAYEPVGGVSVHDVSVYGTGPGFQGQATPGFAAELGLGGGYALNQRWVLALDLLENYAEGSRVNGSDITGNLVRSHGPVSSSFALAPAIEYNWSDNIGIIAGIEFSAAGRNTASYIAPQIALSTSF